MMNNVEENLAMIFGEEEAETYRQERRRRTASTSSDATFIEAEFSDVDDLDRSSDSAVSAVTAETDGDEEVASLGPDEDWVDEPITPVEIPLTRSPGLLFDGSAMTAIDYFKIFFNFNFLCTLASMTNEHAREIVSRGYRPQSRLARWHETNAQELLTFLGILFFMGTVRLSRINSYWAKSHLVTFHLGQYMSRNRFLLILRMLYFQAANASCNIYDKVDYLINYFNNIMNNTVYPEKQLSIDESMVLFRGRLLMRQYIKNKRHKFGVKLYILADSKGLVHRIHMYKGSADSVVGGTGHVKKVVLKLMEDYFDAGHSLYMDNFYNSVDLAEILLEKKTYCTGTLQPKRKGNPVTVTSKKLTRGSSIYRKNRKGVCVMKWKDKRDVLTLSTEHTPDPSESVNRRGRVASKPNIIIQYNKYMKGVDRHDQMLAYYPCEHKSVRWYKKIGIHLFQTMFLNAYFMFKNGTGKTSSLESFRNEVLLGLLPPASRTLPPQLPTHMPKELERNANGVLKRRKCSRCWQLNKKRKDCGMYCPDCDIGLCISCYGPYHIENKLLP